MYKYDLLLLLDLDSIFLKEGLVALWDFNGYDIEGISGESLRSSSGASYTHDRFLN